jgi:hypothetical protein
MGDLTADPARPRHTTSATELDLFESYGAELVEAGTGNGVAMSAAELEKIWGDPRSLLHWTIGMLLEVGEPDAWVLWERTSDERKRQWLQQMARDNPQRHAKLVLRHPDLAKLARKRPPGRPAGRHSPGLAEAWEMAQFIRRKWQEVFGRCYRKQSPTAHEIAAGMYGLKPEQLQTYRTNKNRRKRHD